MLVELDEISQKAAGRMKNLDAQVKNDKEILFPIPDLTITFFSAFFLAMIIFAICGILYVLPFLFTHILFR